MVVTWWIVDFFLHCAWEEGQGGWLDVSYLSYEMLKILIDFSHKFFVIADWKPSLPNVKPKWKT